MKIGFHPVHLSERGTTAAVYDYAYFNETLLGNQSVIFYQGDHPYNFPDYLATFSHHFQCFPYREFDEVDQIILSENIDALYSIKSGEPDSMLAKHCPNLVHAVFVEGGHGDKCAFVSQWLSTKYHWRHPYVPHMISLPHTADTLRASLNIPQDAIVLGGYGGRDSFNLRFVHDCINAIVEDIPNLYFLFMNFNPANTAPHARIIYLPPTIDRVAKVTFINTCDAMIHARDIGETFGLAVGEFSTCNKPVITYLTDDPSYDREHIRNLGEKGIYYVDEQSLSNILRQFRPDPSADWNCYRAYEPAHVMRIFEEVFLGTVTRRCERHTWTLFTTDSISNDILHQQAWEPHVTQALRALLRPGDTAIDVGANFGCHTVTMSECVGPQGTVYAFEPEQVLYSRLVRNLRNNQCDNVIPLKFALSDQTNVVHLTPARWLGNKQNMGDCYISSQGRKTLAMCLDDLTMRRVDLIKLDVQGAEGLCVRGMRGTLRRHRPLLILEIEEYCLQRFGWSSKQLLDVIRSLEYSVFFLEYRYPSEHLCVPTEKVAAFMEHFGDCVSDHADNNPVNRHVEHGVRKKVTFGDRSWMQGSCFAATSSGE